MCEIELTDHAAYNLFRRAIAEQDLDAWAEVTRWYRPLLIAWAARYSARNQVSEHHDAIADQALARAWAALSPARFSGFPSLAALLAYLYTCVTATVIDYKRAQAAHERIAHKLQSVIAATPEQVVLTEMDRAELWRIVDGLAATAQERTILYESFALDLPPRTILVRHPELFADITTVYRVKRNLLNRLQRNRELWELRQDRLAT